MLIAEVEGGQIKSVLEDRTNVVRLGQGVHKNRVFHPHALKRAESCFQEFSALIKAYKVERVIAAATSAARDAKNGEDFLALGQKYGIPIEIIDGPTEARTTFVGATSDLPTGGRYAVVDVGGGSTEIIAQTAQGEIFGKSVDVGSVRLTEMFLQSHPCPHEDLERMEKYIRDRLAEGSISKLDGSTRVVAVAGTPTSLIALEKQIDFDEGRVHRQDLSVQQMARWRDRLARMTVLEREKLPGMPSQRADVIVAGITILKLACEALGVNSVLVSTRGVRFGLALKGLPLLLALTLSVKAVAESVAIHLGKKALMVEVADSEPERARGLMFREKLGRDAGMLFLFDNAQVLSFWMKNTPLPLSIGFFDQKLQLFEVQDMDPPKELMDRNLRTYRSSRPSRIALEVRKGWFKENNIPMGAQLRLPKALDARLKSIPRGP